MDTTVVEQCRISPSHGGAASASAEQLLPLLYFDIVWLPVHPMQTLFFYNFPSSKSHFVNSILPNLKKSLSLAIKHFPPLAGKIVFPLGSGMPVSRYAVGEDSVSLTIAISDSDFYFLTGNHLRDADDLHDFIPEIPPPEKSLESIKIPVMAIQITLFPGQGICIGVANHHAVGDGASIVHFLQTWASINKLNDENHLLSLGRKVLPAYDRTAVQDSDKLTPLIWEMMKNSTPSLSSSISFPTHKLRATFTLTDAQILILKNFLKSKKPGAAHVTSYAAVCARVWCCMAGSAAAAGEKVGDDDGEYLSMPADCRRRLRPPLPNTYFGNCLVLILAESTHRRLIGKDGFVAAAEAIGEAMKESLGNEKGIMDGCIERYLKFSELKGERVVGVSGSPRFELGGVDYGFGGMRKAEALHIDESVSVSLYKTRDGIEVGVSLKKMKMDAFASFFNKDVCGEVISKL